MKRKVCCFLQNRSAYMPNDTWYEKRIPGYDDLVSGHVASRRTCLTHLENEKIVAPEIAQLERVVQSGPFRTSEIHRVLLTYLVEKSLNNSGDSLKEYTVGLEVFHKPSSYDPRTESTVRMHVARLRQKLSEYYQAEGVSDPIVIGLPKGAFKIAFSYRPEPLPDPVPVQTSAQPVKSTWFIAAGLAILASASLAIYFWSARQVKAQVIPPETGIESLWKPLLATDRPLIVCLSDNAATPEITAPGTAEGAFLLGQFFANRKRDVSLEKGGQLSILELGMDNMVFVGPVAGNRNIQRMLGNLDLVLDPKGIRNLKPQPGEPAIIADRLADGLDMEESYALVTHLPGLNGEGDALYLSGNQTGSVVGAVRTFTDPPWARVLVSRLQNGSNKMPRYYQAVLKVRSMEGTPVDVSYVMHREINQSSLAEASRKR